MIITYREFVEDVKRLKSDNEAMYYTKMVTRIFLTLQVFYTKSAMKDDLNHLIDGMGKTNLYL